VPEQAAQVFNRVISGSSAPAFPAMMSSIKDQSDLNELRKQWVLAFVENGILNMAGR